MRRPRAYLALAGFIASLAVAAGAAAPGEPRPTAAAFREQLRVERAENARLVAALRRVPALTPAERHLRAIEACESGGDPRAISRGGTYRGALQFDAPTWRSVGGAGDPAAATLTEQRWRGLLLYQRRGPQPWPVCGAL